MDHRRFQGGKELELVLRDLQAQGRVQRLELTRETNHHGKIATQVTLVFTDWPEMELQGRSLMFFDRQGDSDASAFTSLLYPLALLAESEGTDPG